MGGRSGVVYLGVIEDLGIWSQWEPLANSTLAAGTTRQLHPCSWSHSPTPLLRREPLANSTLAVGATRQLHARSPRQFGLRRIVAIHVFWKHRPQLSRTRS